MTTPTIEIVSVGATEAFINNPHDAVKDAYSILAKQEGQIKSYYGVQHEDKKTAYVVIAWESFEAHKKLMDDKVTYPELQKATATMFDPSKGAPEMIHVKTNDADPYKAFEAPVLELATFTANESASVEKLAGFVEQLAKGANAAPEGAGVLHASWGAARENPNKIVLFIGWTSVDAHWTAVNSNETLKDIISQAREIGKVEVVHVPLSLFKQ